MIPALGDLRARSAETAAVGILDRRGHLVVADSCTRAAYRSSSSASCPAAAAALLDPLVHDGAARSQLKAVLGGSSTSGSVSRHAFVAVPIRPRGGNTEAVLVAAFAGPAPGPKQPSLAARLADQWQAILPRDWVWLIALTVLFGTAVGAILSHRLVRRFGAIAAVAARWSRGDLTPTADATRADELGRLAADLNEMAGQIRRLLATRAEVATQEERRRLQRDLHDGIKQELFAASMYLATADAALADRNGEFAATLAEASASCRRAQIELAVLLGEGGEQLPLKRGLEVLSRQLEQASGVRVTSELASDVELSNRSEEALYRVAQEAFTNIRRHARAATVTVQLVRNGGEARLEINDDGRGFDAAGITAGMGLNTMRERLELIGGELALESSSRGTRITAVVSTTDQP